ncbi:MAG: cytochrome C oxidase subunit IV family protein [Deltaproteobacteria bacterium]
MELRVWRRSAVAAWLALVGMTLLGPSLGRLGLRGSLVTVFLLVLGGLKFVTITRWFMDLKFAHALWQVAMGVYVAVILGFCCVRLLA